MNKWHLTFSYAMGVPIGVGLLLSTDPKYTFAWWGMFTAFGSLGLLAMITAILPNNSWWVRWHENLVQHN